jgi:hypothetical protein
MDTTDEFSTWETGRPWHDVVATAATSGTVTIIVDPATTGATRLPGDDAQKPPRKRREHIGAELRREAERRHRRAQRRGKG